VPKTFRGLLKEILVMGFDEKPNYKLYIEKIKFEINKEV
jgi:hypothetical protein